MGIRAVILLVVDRAQVEVGLQLPVRAFYFPYQVVIVPGGLFVKGLHFARQIGICSSPYLYDINK